LMLMMLVFLLLLLLPFAHNHPLSSPTPLFRISLLCHTKSCSEGVRVG
jgi:hypothetical protein